MTLSDYQVQLGSLVVGAGTDYTLDGPITGLGVPAPRTSDLDRGDRPGVFGGRDVATVRTIGISVSMCDDDPATVMGLVDTLCDAWAPTSTDATLDICLPGIGTRSYSGRPRGVDLDLEMLPAGAARARLVFVALDPDGISIS